ncbi:MAG: LysM peptidoglycan-binding domain-containing protein, partial [Promethearchaeota archaeon]
MNSLRELGTDPDLLKLFEQRSRIVRRLTDKNGHSRGTEYSLEQQKLLLEVEESIQDYFSTQNAKLTDDQLLRYDVLRAKSQNEGLTDDEKIEYATLLTKKTGSEEGDTTAKTRSELLSRLTDLREYRVTDYYIDAALSEVDVKAPTMLTYEEWLTSSSLKTAMQNERFAKWFKSNHYQKYKFVKGKKVLTYYPTSLWTYKAPKNPDYFKVTKLIDPISGKEVTMNGVPTGRRYGYNKVKDEYRTIPVGADRSEYVGTIIDNKGNYLPREYNPNAANSAIDGKYMNEKYAQMKASNSSEFQLLEALKEIHLDIQKNRPLSSKLYLDMPRFSKIIRSNLEIIQSGGVQEKLQTIYENAVSIFKKRGDDVEKFDYGVNFDVDALLIQTDLQGDPISRIPVRGLYNIPIKETSVDILRGLYEYMYSLNEQEVLIKNEPIAQAMSNVFSDPENAIKDQARASKGIFSNTGKIALLKKTDNRRTQALNYFIEKTWYGKAYSNFEQENPMTTKIANMLMHAASRSFIQNNIESAAGKYYNPVSFAKGRFMSAQAMTELSSRGIYSVAPKSLLVQILEYFDPITGKTKSDFGKSTSRTFIKDMLDGTFLYDGRRFLDVEGGLQVLFGMLKHQKIKQTLPNGEVKEITYDEAFELNENNKLVLKEGIDPEWGFEETTHDYVESDTLESIAKKYNTTVDLIKEYNKLESLDQVSPGDTLIISKASKFLDFQLKMQGVGKRLNGMPDRFDSPQGEKFLGYRLFMFYKKYATGMFLNRFQADTSKNNRWGDVYNWELGE